MINLALIPYLTLASRFHGGGFISAPRVIRAAVFAAPYTYLFYQTPYHALAAFILAFVGKNMAHEDFWLMGVGTARPDESVLCKAVLLTGLKRDGLAFCTVGMAVKGMITALGTINPLVILGHAIALPLAYFIGRRTRYGSELAEYLSGLFYAIVLIAVLGI